MEVFSPSKNNKLTKNKGVENPVQLSIDIGQLQKSVTSESNILGAFSSSYCIYRVPDRLRELNEKAYIPRVVSIGPIHYGKENLQAMEELKRMYLQEFLRLSELSKEDFITVIEVAETRLRNCYAEAISLSGQDFVNMVLMDAAFIIMVLLKCEYDFLKSYDPIFYPPLKIHEVAIDMCLLENQLPFFILEDLFKLSKVSINLQECFMMKLTHAFLKKLWGSWVTEEILENIDSSEIQHFVNLLRICQQPTERQPQRKLETLTTPSVKELQQAGVHFVLSSSNKLIDINFEETKGRLEIPRLVLTNRTEILFRNLQAFEQCHGLDYLNDYISLISFLVNSPKDVEILVQNGIIENRLSNNEAVSIFLHNIGKENSVPSNDFCFSSLIEELNAYCKRPWNKWKATLKQDYFNTPWAAISITGAAILLLLSVIQSVCSIIQARQL